MVFILYLLAVLCPYVADLPAHQEIGMPSLSPTMTEVCDMLTVMIAYTSLYILLFPECFA